MKALLSTIIYVFLLPFTKESVSFGGVEATVLLPRMKLKGTSKMNTFEIRCLKNSGEKFSLVRAKSYVAPDGESACLCGP